jgi:hypothetical protein
LREPSPLQHPEDQHRAAEQRAKEKGERKRKWVSPDKAAGMVAEPDLAEVIRNFRRAA